MIATDLETAIERLRELVADAKVIVPFTGAGISTECGIPDFRSPGGIWTKMRPIEFGDFLASQEMRNESWRRRFAMEEQFGGAKPGRGHRALASLYRAGQGAGRGDAEHRQSAPGFRVCGRARGRAARQHHLCHLPRLRQALRTALGEGSGWTAPTAARPTAGLRRLHQDRDGLVRPVDARGRRCAGRKSLQNLAIFSSPSVRRWWSGRLPASRCVAKRNGARLVIINRDPTEFDDIADLVMHHDIGDVLAPFIAH